MSLSYLDPLSRNPKTETILFILSCELLSGNSLLGGNKPEYLDEDVLGFAGCIVCKFFGFSAKSLKTIKFSLIANTDICPIIMFSIY